MNIPKTCWMKPKKNPKNSLSKKIFDYCLNHVSMIPG